MPTPPPPPQHMHTLQKCFCNQMAFVPNPSIMSKDLAWHKNGYFLELQNFLILIARKNVVRGFGKFTTLLSHCVDIWTFIYRQSEKTSKNN